MTAKLASESWGSGQPVVLVHGCVLDEPTTWAAQRPLAETGRWRLIVVQRRGFGASPPSEGDDFMVDSHDLCALLSEPAHLVAHSFGGLGAMSAACSAPRQVRSLVLVEPPAYTAATGDTEVDEAARELDAWWDAAPRQVRSWPAGLSTSG